MIKRPACTNVTRMDLQEANKGSLSAPPGLGHADPQKGKAADEGQVEGVSSRSSKPKGMLTRCFFLIVIEANAPLSRGIWISKRKLSAKFVCLDTKRAYWIQNPGAPSAVPCIECVCMVATSSTHSCLTKICLQQAAGTGARGWPWRGWQGARHSP